MLRTISKISKWVTVIGFGIACATIGGFVIRYRDKKEEIKKNMENDEETMNLTDDEIDKEASKMALKAIDTDMSAIKEITKPMRISIVGHVAYKVANYVYRQIYKPSVIMFEDRYTKLVEDTIRRFIGDGYMSTMFITNENRKGVLVYAADRAFAKIITELKNNDVE